MWNQNVRPWILTACLVPVLAAAHKPSYTDGQHTTEADAFAVANVDTSIVLYHTVTCESPLLWMAFRVDEPRDLYLELGVPVIDRLSDYRPSLAVLAPGLDPPPADLPFEVPDGLGVALIDSRDIDEPGDFFEPFTGTASWVMFQGEVALPEAGIGYLVAWHPERQTGKLWVAVGTIEEFGPEDFAKFGDWLPKTQIFHETGPYELDDDEQPSEVICDPPVEETLPLEPEPREQPEPETSPSPEPPDDRASAPETMQRLSPTPTEDLAAAPEASGDSGCQPTRAPKTPPALFLLISLGLGCGLRTRRQT